MRGWSKNNYKLSICSRYDCQGNVLEPISKPQGSVQAISKGKIL